jgi:hypothetical protein
MLLGKFGRGYGLTPKNWTIEKCSSAQVKGAERNEEEI